MAISELAAFLIANGILCAAWQVGRPAEGERSAVLKLDETYSAGTRVESPLTGISFMIPESFAGGYNRETQMIVLQSTVKPIVVMISGFSETQPQQVLDWLAAITMKDVTFESARPMPDGTIEAIGQASAQERGTYRLVGLIAGGKHGNAIGVFAMGADETREKMKSQLREIVSTVRWSEPGAKQLQTVLSGRRLYRSGSSSMNSAGGAAGTGGGAGFSSKTEAAVDFCSDGSYAYEYASEGYISGDFGGDGMAGSSTKRDAHNGKYRIVSDMAGAKWVHLQTTDGRQFLWSIWEEGSGLSMNGFSYSVYASERCR